ncbi:MAG: FliH/SctL family protein [Phycisphaerales bacterium]|nr:MAG: hypothetical protein IPK69_04045 [Phycisphaerales bacterium]
MALIRQSEFDSLSKDAVALDLGDLFRQGEQIKARARAEADAILAKARSERDRLIASARAEGHAIGEKAGRDAGFAAGKSDGIAKASAEHSARLAEIEAAWIAGLEQFLTLRESLMREAREETVRLALAIAGRVLSHTLSDDPSRMADLVASALANVTHATRLVVEVREEDRALVEASLPALRDRFRQVEHAEVVGVKGAAPGSCVVRLPSGASIDASLSTQIDRIARVILERPRATDSRDAAGTSPNADQRQTPGDGGLAQS